ncbi:nicotinate dehydrogenase subunit B [Caballeronia udeis]|uniref:Nicotinate dehydrogenase subunit B n=1 Tax=Caballeronia udeis TaxID=1232866 RepID=A0ABW8MQR0_9BURK
MSSQESTRAYLPSLEANPRLGDWLRFRREGFVEMYSGKVEIGQGVLTALTQIVASGLEIPFDRVHAIAASTERSPDEGVTSGSLSIQHSGAALRQVSYEAKSIYLLAAAQHLKVPVDAVTIQDGCFRAAKQQVSYWELADDELLNRTVAGAGAPFTNEGTFAERIDLPDKIFGLPRFIHDLAMPGMLHGRILRPPTASATLESCDDQKVLACDGVVAVLRDGGLIGVLTVTERQVDLALTVLRRCAIWRSVDETLPDEDQLDDWLRSRSIDSKVVSTRAPNESENSRSPVRTLKASFSKPFLAHASIAPSCALSLFQEDKLEVWTHSQSIYNLRKDLSLALRMTADSIVVRHVEGAGCYGHNPADDVAFDAAWLARSVPGRVVRVRWTRADELTWAPFSPAMAIDLEADVDEHGSVLEWRHTVWSNGHSTRPGRSDSPALLGSWYLDPPFERQAAINVALSAGGGADRNAVPSYDFRAWNVINNRLLDMPIRTSAMRALGALGNIFAVEQFMEELAEAAGADPVEYRLRHTTDVRARGVILEAIERSEWNHDLPEGWGRGVAFARYKNTGAYCAAVAEIEALENIKVRRLTLVVDVGIAISGDGVVNQIEGGAIQAASWVLKEALRFDRQRVTNEDWESYPILKFTEVPSIDVHIVSSTASSLGAGECSVGPTAAAIANAVSNALGVRIRRMPITPDRIVAAFDQI